MDSHQDTACEKGLRFFGLISASLSHEIKNALAVISESAGLAEDLLLMAEKGAPMDVPRFMKSIQKIQAHVMRTDGIVKNMNTFAHSMDEPVRRADVGEILALTAALTRRLMDMQGITLRLDEPAEPAALVTAPFYLKSLLWLLLEFAMEHRGGEDTLNLSAEKEEKRIRIRLSGLEGLKSSPSLRIPEDKVQPLLDRLNAKLQWQAEKGVLVLALADLPEGS